jgi:cell wall-associated NlpC family hydrolase
MKNIVTMMLGAFLLSGCIFTPPPQTKQEWKKIPTVISENPLIDIALSQLYVPYRYGGMSPDGFDCSGFVCYVYQEGVGKKLPRTARAQSQYVEIIDKEALAPGDLLFFDTSNGGKINHSGIYLGEGKFIHASSGKVYAVTISSLKRGFYKRAFRWGGRVNY